MRQATLLLTPLLLALPLGAQGFEGSVAMRLSGGGNESMEATMYTKGDRQAMVVKLPASAGPMAGGEMRTVMNHATNKITILLPAAPGMPLPPGSKGMKMTMDMTNVTSSGDREPDFTLRKLGSSQTIAGYPCDDYAVTSGKDVMNMCVTDRLGRFTLPGTGGGMGRQQPPPAWARAFGDKPMFPLKVWGNADGTAVQMEVLSVSPGSVPAAILDDAAEGYADMSSMMGGMRRNN